MQYGLTKMVLGFSGFIEFSQEDYVDFLAIRDRLLIVGDVEEKLDLLLENYADFEQILLDLASRSSVF